MVDGAGRYQSFSLLIQPIPTRFELDEMCNLWDRDVTLYFDLHIGGSLLQPYVQGDPRGQIRSLNRQVLSPRKFDVNGRNNEFVSAADQIRKSLNGIHSQGFSDAGFIFVLPRHFWINQDSSVLRISVLFSELTYPSSSD